jgi:purine-binding chemotaxis protein CheW
MTTGASMIEPTRWLLCGANGHLCALPLDHVVEIMRPPPIDALDGMPPFVLGLSVIRGSPIPVVDLGSLIDQKAVGPQRVVTITAGGRTIALAVESVLEVRTLTSDILVDLPPLLRGAAGDVVSAIGTLDSELLLVLKLARIIQDTALNGVLATAVES